MTRKSPQKASFTQKLKVKDLLEEAIETFEDDTCRYKDNGDSDERIAQEVGVTKNTVAHVRKELFGMLVRAQRNPNNVDTEEIQTRFNMLITQLSIQGIREINHLKFKEKE